MNVIQSLFGSKKFIGLLVGMIVVIGTELGLDLSTEALTGLIALISSWLLGQGIADNGKERAKIEKGG